MTKGEFSSPVGGGVVSPRPHLAAACDEAAVLRHFDAADRDNKIAADIRRQYDAEHPNLCVTKMAAEVANEQLAPARSEFQRAHAEKSQAEYLSEKHASGPRLSPLTLHGWLSYMMMSVPSLLGVFVATYALATYASDSGVIAALDHNFLASFIMAFPVVAAGQALKAAGSLKKHDNAKALYFGRLAKLGVVAFALFVLGAAIAFAPHPTDTSLIAETLTAGEPPKVNAFVAAAKEIAPYLTVGGGLVAEIMAAAVIGHRADAIDAMGRSVSQGLTVTQRVLDERILVLQRRIEACAKRSGQLQAEVSRHEAALAARIAAAQAHAGELAAHYAAHKAAARRDFLATLSGD